MFYNTRLYCHAPRDAPAGGAEDGAKVSAHSTLNSQLMGTLTSEHGSVCRVPEAES
jgi:hypothetical protein